MVADGSLARPSASVILPVRNGERWVSACLLSLSRQTFKAFEIILLDHGSTDRTVAMAASSGAPHLRVVPTVGESLGAVLASGVEQARSDILIRMDVDDVAAPSRIAKQFARLQGSPDLVAVGTWATVRHESTSRIHLQRTPVTDAQLRLAMYVGNPFIHSTMAMRRTAVLNAGNYPTSSAEPWPEDLDLWTRLADTGALAVLPEPLVHRVVRNEGVMGVAGREINQRAGALLQERWQASDVPAVRRAAPLAPCFVSRDRRLSVREAAKLMAALAGLRLDTGWGHGRGAWRAGTWLRPAAWAVVPPRG